MRLVVELSCHLQANGQAEDKCDRCQSGTTDGLSVSARRHRHHHKTRYLIPLLISTQSGDEEHWLTMRAIDHVMTFASVW